jgi:hypothetical protein
MSPAPRKTQLGAFTHSTAYNVNFRGPNVRDK